MDKKHRIYVDMDRTLCDYDKGYIKWREGYEYPQSKEGFFRDLDPLPGAIEAYKYLDNKYDVWILTRPSFLNIGCYTEKAEWVLNHLGLKVQQKTILCGNKSLVKGDFLVDDHHKDGQPEFEGIWIQIWKHPFSSWKAVTDFIDEKAAIIPPKN
jgi:5'(3')-deoxyribonucleotidase